MIVVSTQEELRAAIPKGKKVGFVPTMGALHEGHASLLKQARAETDFVVLSIFVNPTQFGPNEDFSKYPRTLEKDLEIAEEAGVDMVFTPTAVIIYPKGWSTYIEVEKLTDSLCGKFRPGHFRGVATVVYRLLQLVKPHVAFFGQKDLQQCLVIQKMVKDLELPVEIRISPTVRETDGLAMSSRNRYLSPEDREKALVISRALFAVKRERVKNVSKLLQIANQVLAEVPEFKVQYVEIRSVPDLEEIEMIDGRAAIAIAGYLGNTRLIDNMLLAD